MIRAWSYFQMPGMSWVREMRPVPIAPTLIRLLGAVAPEDRGRHDGREPGGERGRTAEARRRRLERLPTRDRARHDRPPSEITTLFAAAWAFRTISAARKECACVMAVSVRSSTSDTSRGP